MAHNTYTIKYKIAGITRETELNAASIGTALEKFAARDFDTPPELIEVKGSNLAKWGAVKTWGADELAFMSRAAKARLVRPQVAARMEERAAAMAKKGAKTANA